MSTGTGSGTTGGGLVVVWGGLLYLVSRLGLLSGSVLSLLLTGRRLLRVRLGVLLLTMRWRRVWVIRVVEGHTLARIRIIRVASFHAYGCSGLLPLALWVGQGRQWVSRFRVGWGVFCGVLMASDVE